MDTVEAVPGLSNEEQLRARTYAFLSHLLARCPDAHVLDLLCHVEGDATPFGMALVDLRRVAAGTSLTAVEREYDALFVGLSGGEVTPHASYYLSGFLYDRPLAALRDDLAALGIGQSEGVAEPEDHLASLFEVMQGLITGSLGKEADIADQERFFAAHVASWAPRFFADLEAAPSAVVYRPVARLGRLFLAVEAEAFTMA